MKRKLENYYYGGIIIAVLLISGIIFVLPNNTIEYPNIKSRYDYYSDTNGDGYYHMKIADNIMNRRPDCYVDTKDYFEGRAWSCIMSSLIFYDNTKDTKYLDHAMLNLEKVYARALDSNSDGLKDFRGYYILDNDHTIHIDGYFGYMFAEASYIINSNNADKYQANADKYDKLVDNDIIPYLLLHWKPYEVNGRERGYFISKRSDRTGMAIPYNQGSAAMATFLRRGIETDNAQWINIAQRYTNRFTDLNPVKEYSGNISVYNTDTWKFEQKPVTNMPYMTPHYYLFDKDSGEVFFANVYQGETDLNHVNIEFNAILLAYENKLMTSDQLTLLTNAFEISTKEIKVGTRNSPGFNWKLTPPRKDRPTADDNLFRQTGFIYNIIRLGIIDKEIVYESEEVLRNLELDGQLQGSYYSGFYRCAKYSWFEYAEFCYPTADMYREYYIEDMSIRLGIANLGRFQ